VPISQRTSIIHSVIIGKKEFHSAPISARKEKTRLTIRGQSPPRPCEKETHGRVGDQVLEKAVRPAGKASRSRPQRGRRGPTGSGLKGG